MKDWMQFENVRHAMEGIQTRDLVVQTLPSKDLVKLRKRHVKTNESVCECHFAFSSSSSSSSSSSFCILAY